MLSRMPRSCRHSLISTRTRFAATAVLALTTLSGRPTPTLCFATTHRFSSFHRGFGSRCSLAMSSSTTEPTTTTMDTEESSTSIAKADPKLDSLRSLLRERGLDVYLIPSDDPHLSEYVPDAYKRRGYLSGFHGSAGTAVVSQKKALLWTDSRYFNEATLQLDANHWMLQKSGQPKVPTIPKYLCKLALEHYQENQTPLVIGMDPYVHAASFCKELEDALEETAADESMDDAKIGVLSCLEENLVDVVWGSDRPALPTAPFRVHPIKYAGMSVADKIAKIRKEMKAKKATLSVFCTLDDVAYLLNLRAMGDVETCPVGISYATVSHDAVTLYCDDEKVASSEVRKHLKEAGVDVKPYSDIVSDVEAHAAQQSRNNNKVWIDKSRANYALCHVIPTKLLVDAANAVTALKACKNDAELEGMRRAHIVDGAAMAHFMAWLTHAITVEKRTVSEVEIDQVLTGYRAQQPGFLEVSFPTIAGVGSNGAIIHYRAQEGTDLLQHLDGETPILIDSGGQYTYGTTDVTRTWHFGTPTPEFVDSYTRVLKGNIGVDEMQFPEGTPGFVLDVFARKSLWEKGQDYGHGTGHGVGAALNVHEGPHSISPRWGNTEGLKQGMIVSNEPGYYEDGNYGVRIENLLEIQYVNPQDAPQQQQEESDNEQDDETSSSAPAKKTFLKFGKLTMIPIQKNLINLDLMTDSELDWLDEYHQEVYDKVSPLLEPDSDALRWLAESCTKMERN